MVDVVVLVVEVVVVDVVVLVLKEMETIPFDRMGEKLKLTN